MLLLASLSAALACDCDLVTPPADVIVASQVPSTAQPIVLWVNPHDVALVDAADGTAVAFTPEVVSTSLGQFVVVHPDDVLTVGHTYTVRVDGGESQDFQVDDSVDVTAPIVDAVTATVECVPFDDMTCAGFDGADLTATSTGDASAAVYEFEWSSNADFGNPVTLASATYDLEVGQSECGTYGPIPGDDVVYVRARARDGAGNVGAWSAPTTVSSDCDPYDDSPHGGRRGTSGSSGSGCAMAPGPSGSATSAGWLSLVLLLQRRTKVATTGR